MVKFRKQEEKKEEVYKKERERVVSFPFYSTFAHRFYILTHNSSLLLLVQILKGLKINH